MKIGIVSHEVKVFLRVADGFETRKRKQKGFVSVC